MKRWLITGFLAAAGMVPQYAPAEAANPVLAQANAALQAGEADKALSLLASLPQGGAE